MKFHEAFDFYIKGQKAVSYNMVGWSYKEGQEVPYGLCITYENGAKMYSHGGGCSGEDCNTTWIVDGFDTVIAMDNW